MKQSAEKKDAKSAIQILFERVLIAMVFSCVTLNRGGGCFGPGPYFGQEVLDPIQIELMYNKERRLQLIPKYHDPYLFSSDPEKLLSQEIARGLVTHQDVPRIPLAPIPPYLAGQNVNPQEDIDIKSKQRLRVA